MKLLVFVVLLLPALSLSASTKGSELRKKILEDYDIEDPPAGVINDVSYETANITTNFYIRRLSDIDLNNGEFTAQLTFRQAWNDPRLHYDADGVKYLHVNPSSIWTPDTFFSNEIESTFHTLIKPNQLIRVYPNGDVLYSIRITLKLSCDYPKSTRPEADVSCTITLASYGYTTEVLRYVWKSEGPIQTRKKGYYIPGWKLVGVDTDDCTAKTNTGEYSCLKAILNLKRQSAGQCEVNNDV